MAQASRDNNEVTAALGSFNGTPTALKVEHATGYLKVTIIPGTLSAPTINIQRAKHDDNNVHSDTGSYLGTVKPLLTQNSTGYLRAVIV